MHGSNLLGLDIVRALRFEDSRLARVTIGHSDAAGLDIGEATAPIDRVVRGIAQLVEVVVERGIRPPLCSCVPVLEGRVR